MCTRLVVLSTTHAPFFAYLLQPPLSQKHPEEDLSEFVFQKINYTLKGALQVGDFFVPDWGVFTQQTLYGHHGNYEPEVMRQSTNFCGLSIPFNTETQVRVVCHHHTLGTTAIKMIRSSICKIYSFSLLILCIELTV